MNGYIQIDLSGKLRSLKFNMYAVEIIAARQVESESGNLAIFIYAGLCGNAFAKSAGTNPVCEETFEEVLDIAEELLVNGEGEKIKSILEAYYRSRPIQKVLEAEAEETAKKKTRKPR